VSRSAVSRAYTPGAHVSAETRRRIYAAAEELGYRVNRLARSLHQPRSDLVGVVGANLANPYISAQLAALSAALQRRRLQCLLLNTAGSGPGAQVDLARLLDYRVRTVVLLSGAAPDALIRLCAQNGARMVLINRPAPPEGAAADLILADSAEGGRLAAARLRAAGCRNVAVVISASRTSAKLDRARAFAAALARLYPPPQGLPVALPEDELICRCEDVTAGDIANAIAEGAHESFAVKTWTRAGMGPCQGRICGAGIAAALAQAGVPADRASYNRAHLPLRPVPLPLVRATLQAQTEMETRQ